MKLLRPVVLASFAVMGACWLIQGAVWSRAGGIILGTTALATAAVISALLGGFAAGAWRVGRNTDANPLRRFGMFEAGAAVSALLVTLLLGAPIFPGTVEMRAFLAGALLFLPAALSGAGLVTALRALSILPGAGPADTGKAIALSLAGAFVGILAAGFMLLPSLGMFLTAMIAAAVRMAVAAAALALGGKVQPAEPPEKPSSPPIPPILVPVLAGAIGFAALLFVASWTRAAAFSFGPTVYTSMITAAAFLLGLSVGCAVTCSRAVKSGDPIATPGFILGGSALVAVGLGYYLGELPLQMVEIGVKFQEQFGSLLALQALLLTAFVSLPAALLGASLPYFWRLAAASGRPAGTLLAWIALGGAIGTLAAQLLLIPTFGAHKTLTVAVSICCAAGVALFMARRPPWIWYAVTCSGLLAGSWALHGWDSKIISCGPYIDASFLRLQVEVIGKDLRYVVENSNTIKGEYRDSRGFITAHSFVGGIRRVRVNGKTHASTHIQYRMIRTLLGHLPLLHGTRTENVIIMGVGNGDTLGAVASYSQVKRIEVTGNSIDDFLAALLFERSREILKDPRVKLLFGDARYTLVDSPAPYDIIICTPSDLWTAEAACLYTREFYEAAKSRLESQGLMAQRVNTTRLTPGDLRSIFRTFFEAFPAGSVWEVTPGRDYILLGALSATPVAIASVEQRLKREQVSTDLEDLAIDSPPSLLRHLLMNREAALAYAGEAPVLTDDLNPLEYHVPRTLLSKTCASILDSLEPVRRGEVDGGIYDTMPPGSREERTRRADLALAARTAEEDKDVEALGKFDALRDDTGALDPAAESLYSETYFKIHHEAEKLRRYGEFEKAFEKLLVIPESAACYAMAQSRAGSIYRKIGRLEKAKKCYEKAIKASPDYRGGYKGLALIAGELADLEGSADGWFHYLTMFPEDSWAYVSLSVAYFKLGLKDEALDVARKGLTVDPENLKLRALVEP